jgi:hypothetical protein
MIGVGFLFALALPHVDGRLHNLFAHKVEKSLHDVSDVQCKWDDQQFLGRCMVEGIKDEKAKSTEACKASCCKFGIKCASWQYRDDSGCMLNDDVRHGSEGRNSPGWCEPVPPAKWSGRIMTARASDGKCSWEEEAKELIGQCFGFGPEVPAGKASKEACSDVCCADKNCEAWQWRADKGLCFNTNAPQKIAASTILFNCVGCFTGGKPGACDDVTPLMFTPYTGGRKTVPPGCKIDNGHIKCEGGKSDM